MYGSSKEKTIENHMAVKGRLQSGLRQDRLFNRIDITKNQLKDTNYTSAISSFRRLKKSYDYPFPSRTVLQSFSFLVHLPRALGEHGQRMPG